jgi:4-hydroxy-tetrahydrodipicolinate synthase
VQQQIEKTQAHLIGAAVPSSDERWNCQILPPVFLFGTPRTSDDGFPIGHFFSRNSRVRTHNSPFCGLWIALITPFRNGEVDHTALAQLVDKLGKDGVAGFVACGSTGEAAALDHQEQLAVLQTVLKASPGLPVVMGTSGYHLPHMLQWVQTLGEVTEATRGARLAGVLVSAPHYIRPSQAGLLHWFGAIADASAVPLLVYDIPYRTGVSIHTETLLQLAAHPNIHAVKDCGGDARKTQALIADSRLQLLAGEDAQIFGAACLGAAGAISAGAHLHTARIAQTLRLLQNDQLTAARTLWAPLPAFMDALFAEPNPALVKAMLAREGWMANELRAPMMAASSEGLARVLELDGEISRL